MGPREQIFFVVGFRDKVVGPAFEPPKDVFRLGKGCQENDGDFPESFIILDIPAKL